MKKERQTKLAGYDAPVSFAQDRFGRRHFARRIYDLIERTPRGWSVRIGVHGEWGQGKSSVLEFIEHLARDKHVIVRFSPWPAHNQDEVWTLFLVNLIDGLRAVGVSLGEGWGANRVLDFIDRTRPTMRLLARMLRRSRSAVLASESAQFLLQDLLRPGGSLIRILRGKLGDKRVVVLIDDLDRARPAILPDLFLALRDVFDIPEFAFVLAFEQETVSKAISNERPAIQDGKEFLEKLLDFTFDLPGITENQKLHFALSELEISCSFSDVSGLDKISQLLPGNPRKLKRFIRHISDLEPQVKRHDADELSWPIIFLVQLIRLESEKFLWRYIEDRDDEAGIWFAFYSNVKEEERQQAIADRIDKLFEESDIYSEPTRGRLKTLAIGLHDIVSILESHHLKYSAEIWSKPHAITWKEFRNLFVRWRKDQKSYDVNAWLIKHAKEVGHSLNQVADELFFSAQHYRVTSLEGAASARSADRQSEYAQAAGDALELTVCLYLHGLDAVGEEYFRNSKCFADIFGTSVGWAHFTGQESDRTLRDQEEDAIRRISEARIRDPLGVFAKLKPWYRHSTNQIEFDRLGGLCFPIFEKEIARDFLDQMITDHGLALIGEAEERDAQRYVILRPDGALWSGPLVEMLFKLAERASNDPIIHENFYRLFYMITDEFDRKSDGGKLFVDENAEVLVRVWAAATDRMLQYRVQKEFLEAREKVIGAGLSPENMPVPEWLKPTDDTH